MIIYIDAEKASNKFQHPFMIKNSEESRNKWNSPQNLNDRIWQTDNQQDTKCGKPDIYCIKSGMREECPLFPHLFNIAQEFLG
jgi:hypothetical protein